jgi:hypothetical protein
MDLIGEVLIFGLVDVLMLLGAVLFFDFHVVVLAF